MSAAQFTPGPWNVGRQRKIYAGVETPIAQSIAVDGDYPAAKANAHLIAAAPDLYEALKRLLDDQACLRTTGATHFEQNAFSALAKARGNALHSKNDPASESRSPSAKFIHDESARHESNE